MRSLTPFLWFDNDLEEAVERYTSLFPDGKVHGMVRSPDGRVLTVDFEIAGQYVRGLNGGPEFPHTEAFSFFVECDDQEEVDHYWTTLTAGGGRESQCGWLKDRFGVSWQVIPTEFLEIMSKGTPEQSQRAFAAMQTMQKLDVAALREAAAG